MAGYKAESCGVNTAKLPLLTNEEKEELFKRILDGDQEAREQYIKGNLRLVLSVIQRFSNNKSSAGGSPGTGCGSACHWLGRKNVFDTVEHFFLTMGVTPTRRNLKASAVTDR